jgi:hypothetical protein
MGTYFALMDEAAKRAEDYKDLDRIKDVLEKIQNGVTPEPHYVLGVLKQLDEWAERVSKLMVEQPTVAEPAQQALDRLEGLKSALEASLSAVHR